MISEEGEIRRIQSETRMSCGTRYFLMAMLSKLKRDRERREFEHARRVTWTWHTDDIPGDVVQVKRSIGH